MDRSRQIPIIIPAYQPDERLCGLVQALQAAGLDNIVVVDDGGGSAYAAIFARLRAAGCTVLTHAVNQGKGRALKTAFNYCLNTYPELIGCVTADSDGQHTVPSIRRCVEALAETPDRLILGCRDFNAPGVPDKSRMGNKISVRVCAAFCGVKVSDTQTGLRGIPKDFMAQLLNVAGERFEFETNMLIYSKDRIRIREVEIETVYDSRENHTTHFNPVLDSIRIYRLFLGAFARFLLSSLSSSCIDLALFALFCGLLRGRTTEYYDVLLASALARILSAVYNYCINYKLVFAAKAGVKRSAVRYALLAIVQGTISSVCVARLVSALQLGTQELLVKIPVDVVLFLVSFVIQREFVYGKRDRAE